MTIASVILDIALTVLESESVTHAQTFGFKRKKQGKFQSNNADYPMNQDKEKLLRKTTIALPNQSIHDRLHSNMLNSFSHSHNDIKNFYKYLIGNYIVWQKRRLRMIIKN